MRRVLLTKLKISNFGPIKEDEVILGPFTYFVGRNNAGKSHYLKAIDILLATKAPEKEEIVKIQNNKSKPVEIEGYFEGVESFTHLVEESRHKQAIENEIRSGVLDVVRILDPAGNSEFGVRAAEENIIHPTGFSNNLLKVLPEPIVIWSTADTADELKNTQGTALAKLKKEALSAFFEELKVKADELRTQLDVFLHSKDPEQRSQALIQFESHLQEELIGEFAGVVPEVEFGMPIEEAIAKEMKLFLSDPERTEVEQKGHGLQRAILLALLKVLAKHGARYQNKPTPIFLISEIESFLHPFAQKQLAEALELLAKSYQLVASTHSPFIISPGSIEGYRRVEKNGQDGTKSVMLRQGTVDIDLIKRLLEKRGNLEGLFADRIVLIEGKDDEPFYERIPKIFGIPFPQQKFTIFVRAGGKKELRQARKFYRQMGFDDVAVICDVDYLFSNDIIHLFQELDLDDGYPKNFRQHIGLVEDKDLKLQTILDQLQEKGEPEGLDKAMRDLREHRIFVLRHGSPEIYCKHKIGDKVDWTVLNAESDLLHPEYLKELMTEVLS